MKPLLCRSAVVAFVLSASTVPILAQQSPTPSRIRGTIESADGDVLNIQSRSGEMFKVRVSDKIVVTDVVKMSLADIKQGSFVGAAAMPQPDGSQKAMEVHVFPEEMRGRGEGFRPFDLRPNSTMTNATVENSVVSNDGKTLTVKYKGGEKEITVSPDTPVVTFAAGQRSELIAGAKVIAMIAAQSDGTLETTRVSVGRDGLTPPM